MRKADLATLRSMATKDARIVTYTRNRADRNSEAHSCACYEALRLVKLATLERIDSIRGFMSSMDVMLQHCTTISQTRNAPAAQAVVKLIAKDCNNKKVTAF